MVVIWVLEQVSLIVADTILSVRFFSTSTPVNSKVESYHDSNGTLLFDLLLSSSLVTEMVTTVVEVEVELTTLELELTFEEMRSMKEELLLFCWCFPTHLAGDEADEGGAAHVLDDRIVPVPGAAAVAGGGGVGHHDRGVADHHHGAVGGGGGVLGGGDDAGQLGRGLVQHLRALVQDVVRSDHRARVCRTPEQI